MCLVLVDGGGADDLEVAPGQGGLEDVGRVGGALGGAGADDGVELVDEQDDVAVLLYFVDGGLDALLKVAPVLGAGYHAGEVQRHQTLALQGLGHLPGVDLQGQALGHGGLAHAGLADEHRVVLGPAGQNLHHPLDLLLPADDRVDLPLFGQLGQVAAELVQGLAAGLALLAGGVARSIVLEGGVVQQGGQLPHHPLGVCAQQLEEPHGVAAGVLQDGDEDVLGAHVGVVHLGAGHGRHLQNLLGAGGKGVGGQAGGRARANALPDELLVALGGDAQFVEHIVGHAAALFQEAQHQVLAADIVVAQLLGGGDRQVQGVICFFGKSLETIHTLFTPLRRGWGHRPAGSPGPGGCPAGFGLRLCPQRPLRWRAARGWSGRSGPPG